MAGTKKTIYLSERNMFDIEGIKALSEKTGDSKSAVLTRMINEYKKMKALNIAGISEGAYLALAKGEFEKIHTLTFEDGRKMICINEEYHREYAEDIKNLMLYLETNDTSYIPSFVRHDKHMDLGAKIDFKVTKEKE
jgi:hypothetical protein